MGLRFLTLGALALCMAPAGEGGAGGGGGSGIPAGGDGGGQPAAPFTPEQEKALNDVLNKALGARDKRFAESFGKSLDEKLGKLAESFAPKPKDDEGGGEPGSKKVDPELVKLKQQLEAQGKAFEAEKKARLDAEGRSRTEKARGQLTTALSKHVRPEAVSVLLKAMSGDVQFGDDGEPMLPLPDGTGTSTIEAAVEAWTKTDGAKLFLPAPNSGGAGTSRGSGGAQSQEWRNKPRAQWNEADKAAAYAENLKRNAGLGV